MQKITLFFSLLLIFGLTACTEDAPNGGEPNNSGVPEAIAGKFATDFSGATDEHWQGEGDYYAVEFRFDGAIMEVVYNAEGKEVMRETEIDPAALPDAIKGYMLSNYPGNTVEEADKIEMDGEVHYEVEFQAGDNEVGLVFDADGNLVDQEVEGEEDDDDGDDD